LRIGLITEGIAEFRSMGVFLRRIVPSASVSGPTRVKASPEAKPELTAGEIARQLPTLAADEAAAVLVIIDRDRQVLCPPSYARSVEEILRPRCRKHGIRAVRVVVKDPMFENWLVSDPSVFLKFPKRYHRHVANSIRFSGNADSVDAGELLRRLCVKDYDKVIDAMVLARELNPETMARNSRSFDKFLRELYSLTGGARRKSRSRR